MNSLKTTTDTTTAQLQETDIYVTRHPFLDDCLLIKVQGPFDIPVENKRITVDKATAESILLGANVYAPGVKKRQGVHKSDSVNIVDTHGQIVATGIARLSETEILSHICRLTWNRARVISIDRKNGKIDATKQTLTRLGCECVQRLRQDAPYLHMDFPTLKADRVLVDLPCSALGLTPKLYQETTLKEIENLANYQKQFLNAARRVVKKKGTIPYSLCTITVEECEEVITYAQQKQGLELISQDLMLGARGYHRMRSSRFHPTFMMPVFS